MPIEAYQIGVSLIADESRVTGPLRQMVEMLQRVQAATRETQTGINEMVGSIRGAARVTASLASNMERVAKAAQAAARAGSSVGGSGGAARPEAASGRAGRGRATEAAAAVRVPPALLTYESQSRALTVQNQPRVSDAPAGPIMLTGPQVPLMLGAPSVGGALVPTGRGWSQGSQAYGPFAGNIGRNAMPGAGGFASPYAGSDSGPTINMGGNEGAVVPYGGAGFSFNEPRPPINLNYSSRPPLLPSRASRSHFAVQGGIEAYEGFEFLKNIFEATEKPDDEIAKMRAARFTDAQIEQSKAAALAIQRRTPGMGYASGLELINQTASFTGDVGEALALSPTLARNAQVLAQYGKGDAIAQVEKGIQAGELTGLTGPDGKMNIPKLQDFITRLTGTVVAGGGTLNIGKYLTGVRQFGVGADSASMDFTTAVLPAYMKIMGEAKAGTALSSFQQSLGSTAPRTQNKSITAEQKRLGLRDAKGELVDGDLLRTNANDYIGQKFLPKIGADLSARGIEITPQAIQAELAKLLPRQTMIRLAAAGIFDAAVITKEADRNRAQQAAQADAEKAGKAGPLDTLLSSAPGNQVKATVEAFRTFEAALGEPAMKSATSILNGITDGLLKMAGWAREHPDITEAALKGVAGGLAVLGGAAALTALTLIGGTGGLLAGVGAGAAAAATGMEKLDAALHKFLPGVFGPQVTTPSSTYNPARDGPIYDPSKHGLPSRLWNDPGGTLFGFGGRQLDAPPSVQKESYARPANSNAPVIQNIMYLDGEVVHRSVTARNASAARSSAQQGMTGFDSSETPFQSGGMIAL